MSDQTKADNVVPVGSWQRVASEQLADCKVFQVRQDRCVSSRDGREHKFYCIEAPAWVNVIALTPDKQLVLIEQFRHGSEEITLELPGGMADEGEDPHLSAARELLEETGYAAREVITLGKSRPNPAIQNNWVHHFLALDAELKQNTEFDETEDVVTRLVPLSDVPQLIASGKISHALVLAAFYWFNLWQARK